MIQLLSKWSNSHLSPVLQECLKGGKIKPSFPFPMTKRKFSCICAHNRLMLQNLTKYHITYSSLRVISFWNHKSGDCGPRYSDKQMWQ